MKNRFYDAKMHGANWNAARKMYEPLLEHLVDEEELHTIMMMMIGQLNASHTGVSGGPDPRWRDRCRRAIQVSTSWPIHPGYYKVGHIYKDGPADHDYLKIETGNFIDLGRRSRAEDDRQLLAVLHPRSRQQVPFPAQRQAGARRARGK